MEACLPYPPLRLPSTRAASTSDRAPRAWLAARSAAKIAAAAVVATGLQACTAPTVTVEILPPRTSVTCAAPSAQDAALGRGLFDVAAADAAHGSYLADLRLAVAGSDAHVDGVQLDLTAPEGASAAVTDAAGAVDGTNTGDVLLYGSSDDVRRAVVENVELLTRDLAVALGDDSGLDLSATQYATVELTLTPVVRDAGFTAASTTFALDVCKGCLVDAPSTDECPAGAVATSVCRLGQDVDSFTCATGVVP